MCSGLEPKEEHIFMNPFLSLARRFQDLLISSFGKKLAVLGSKPAQIFAQPPGVGKGFIKVIRFFMKISSGLRTVS